MKPTDNKRGKWWEFSPLESHIYFRPDFAQVSNYSAMHILKKYYNAFPQFKKTSVAKFLLLEYINPEKGPTMNIHFHSLLKSYVVNKYGKFTWVRLHALWHFSIQVLCQSVSFCQISNTFLPTRFFIFFPQQAVKYASERNIYYLVKDYLMNFSHCKSVL